MYLFWRQVGLSSVEMNSEVDETSIPHICHFFYTTAIRGLEILHLKVRKFAEVASRQNSVN